MKKRIIQFLTTYFLFVLLFALQKPIFMVYYRELYINASLGDYFRVMWHGLPLDLSLAGYLTAIPGLLLIASAWTDSSVLRRIRQVYFGLIAFIMACIFIVDLGLYGFWGFRLDATPIFYFFSSPKDAMASVSFWFVLLGIVAMLIYAGILYCIFYYVLIREKNPMKIPYRRQNVSLALLLLTAALFIPIRGGFTVSTMNLSKVYFSSDQLMNHAAINPAFSFMYSATHQNNFEKQYRFMDPNTADKLFAEMVDKPATPADSIPQLLNTQRPNIVFIILESFSTHLMETFGGQPNVAVNMDKFAKEGILFSNFYANSFRTDRGLASIISGYPGQPSTSIMKYPEKTDKLPSIPRSLKNAGYNLEYYYGGDADFTNMRSYLVSSGIGKIICDKDFPLSERTGKWGAQDHVLFQRLLKDMKEEKQQEPFLKLVQTSSSHEPFEVPFHRLDDKVLNAFAYADSCVGDFIKQEVDNYLHKNSDIADVMYQKIQESEKERKAIAGVTKLARERAKKANLHNRKLRDCRIHLNDPKGKGLEEESCIFITEGDSASGSITKSRDVNTQAVFSLRGKPLNSFGLTKKVVYENEEFNLLQAALNIEEGIEGLRYNKVIVATDADVDGMHIRLLLITFFLQFFPDLIKKGHVYILQTPLFRVRNKKKTIYCYSEEERINAINELSPNPEITRFKGLGEISPDEFKHFIGKDMRLEQVTLRKTDAVKELLEFYMGKNTMERQNFIIDNLVIEEDLAS